LQGRNGIQISRLPEPLERLNNPLNLLRAFLVLAAEAGEPTMQLLGEKGIFLSLQALDEGPATQTEDVKAKKHLVVQGTDNAFRWAKKHHVKLAWGTDLMFIPAQNKNQNTDILKLKQWFTPAETDVYDQGRQRRLHWHRRS